MIYIPVLRKKRSPLKSYGQQSIMRSLIIFCTSSSVNARISCSVISVIPFILLDGFAFTDINEATKVAEILKSAKSLRKVDYDWNKLGSDYKFLKKSERYKFNGNSDFDIISGWAYSDEIYAKISNFADRTRL